MSPRTIVRAARAAGLSLIALTDHNTARNAPAFREACQAMGLAALFGCEVTSSEEVHVLALFEEADVAVEFGDLIYSSLPDDHRDPEAFGDQVVVNGDEEIVETLDRFLIGAATYGLDVLGSMIHERGGLFVPAHVDRNSFSVWSQLGFLPPDEYDATEMVHPAQRGRIDPGVHPVICNSDAHRPEDIGRRSFSYEADEPTFVSLRDALSRKSIVCTTEALRGSL